MNPESEEPRTSSRLWVRTASVHTQASSSRGRFPKGSFVLPLVNMIRRIRTIDALVLKPIAGVGARQAAQRHQPRHESHVGFRFASLDKLVRLIEACEVMQRLGQGGGGPGQGGLIRSEMTSPTGINSPRLRFMTRGSESAGGRLSGKESRLDVPHGYGFRSLGAISGLPYLAKSMLKLSPMSECNVVPCSTARS